MRGLSAFLFLSVALANAPYAFGQSSANEVFAKRLQPILASPNPSSCVQCHLADVDLKNHIRPTHEETFRVLRDQGLIDLEQPEKSKILQLIKRGEEDSGAALIHQKNRRAEYEAFRDWIMTSAKDPKLRNLPKQADDPKGQNVQLDVIRHGRIDRVLASFENTIWAMRFRCMSCHLEGSAENRKLVEKHGPRVAWFKASGPKESLEYLLDNPRLIDLDSPERSLLLLKPLDETKHGGGKKFIKGDQGYNLFLGFVTDVAKLKKGDYRKTTQLPDSSKDPRRFGTDVWLKIADAPIEWGDRLLQVDVHAWDKAADRWEERPIATSDRVVWGKGRLWQHNLTLLADPMSARSRTWSNGPVGLPPEKYFVKMFIVQGDGDAPQKRFVGHAEIQSDWPAGYGRMSVIPGKSIRSVAAP